MLFFMSILWRLKKKLQVDLNQLLGHERGTSARDYLRVATKKLRHKGVFGDYSKPQADITYVLNYEKGLYLRVASN